jgi:hypothetical protein
VNNATSNLGTLNLLGSSTTGGSSAVKAGSVLVQGGSSASSSSTAYAGSVQLESGGSSNNAQEGIVQVVQLFHVGATATTGNIECFASQMQVQDCGASPTNVVGILQGQASTSPVTVVLQGMAVVNSSNSATVGHTVCAGSTAGEVTDSGGTSACTLSTGIGIVAATSGTWTLPDGSSAAASSTAPLIVIVRD